MKRISYALAFICLSLSACYSLAEDITPPPGYVYETPRPSQVPTEVMYFPLMPPNPEVGEAIFLDKCAPCHGETGLGDGPEANELPNPVAPIGDPELARQRTPEDWFRMVTTGNIDRFMPPFLSLTERQRWDVVSYAFTLSVPNSSLENGKMVYLESCAGCHGDTGLGDGAQAVDYDPGPGNFRNQAIMAERSLDDLLLGMTHPEISNDIPDFEGDLAESQRWDAAQFIRSLSFSTQVEDLEPPTAGPVDPIETGEEAPVNGDTADSIVQGSITGQVVNASGGDLPEDLEVTLYGFDQFQQTITRTIGVDSAGAFEFEDVDMPEGRAFLVAVEFDRGTYTSDIAVAEADSGVLFLPVSVFESTTDRSQLTIDRLHVFFDFVSPEMVRIAELILVTNPTNKVVVAEQEGLPVLEFDLPPGAVNLQFQEGTVGNQFVLDGASFGDLRGISPGIGQHQILFSFDMPYSRELALNQQIDLPVSALVVLLPDVGVDLEGDFLVPEGVQQVEGRPYQLYTGGSLPAGSTLPIGLSGRLDSGAGSLVAFESGDSLLIGLVSLGLVFMFVGSWLYLRRRREALARESFAEEEPLPQHIAEMDVDSLLDSIITLDDRFKAGDLPESAYLKQRSLLKNHLRDVLEQE